MVEKNLEIHETFTLQIPINGLNTQITFKNTINTQKNTQSQKHSKTQKTQKHKKN